MTAARRTRLFGLTLLADRVSILGIPQNWWYADRSMPHIFISHIHEDEIAVNALVYFLRSQLPKGMEVFSSSTDLRLGDEWLGKIRVALKSSKIVIALLSPEAIERPWVNFEAGGAWFTEGKTLIPLCIGGLNPAELPKPYSNIQGANLEDPATPWSLIVHIWRFLELWDIEMCPPPFGTEHEAVQMLMNGVQHWKESVTRDS